jgi:non-specific serine/threonine protein kinase
VEKYKDSEKTEMLKQMIYPFVLRRKKEDVEKDLPEKIEVIETLKMEEEQRQAYVQTAQYYTEWIAHAIDEQGIGKSAFKILEGMLRLRQICLFPQLADPEYETIPSVKFEHFTEMMSDILSEGHKVLVFSQFVKALTLIRNHFDREKITYSYIDGSVDAKVRGKMIKAFQEDERVGVFLLSLKAGGVALNLTAADYVIIFDPWWNPAVEAQAIDRSHRIGQTKKVFVYRLVVKDTIEEKMLKLQEQKRDLVEKLITSETKAFKNLTKDDIMNLFRPHGMGDL